MGSVADGQFALTLHRPSPALQPGPHPPAAEAEQRLQNAFALAANLDELITTPQRGVSRHPAWRLLSGVVNHALSYDASVTDPGTLLPYGHRLDQAVMTCAQKILDIAPPCDTTTMTQLRLSRDTGGCGLRSAAERCHTAFLATVVRLGRCGPEVSPWLQHATTTAIHGLHALGLTLDHYAMPHPRNTPPANPFSIALLRPPLPKRQRSWWTCLDTLRRSQLGPPNSIIERRIHSCGGPEGGAFILATRADGVRSLPDAFFGTAMRYRLGLPLMPTCSCFHHTPAKPGVAPRRCGAVADQNGEHAINCKVGGAPYAAHGEGCHILLNAETAAGFQARREQVIPELATQKCASPQLDIEGWGLQGQPRSLVYFTIRNPLARRYEKQSTEALASEEKETAYPRKQGLCVTVASIETFGRHSKELRNLLAYLADLARQRQTSFGQSPSRWLRRWRAQLSSCLAHFVGRAVQQARHPPSPSVAAP